MENKGKENTGKYNSKEEKVVIVAKKPHMSKEVVREGRLPQRSSLHPKISLEIWPKWTLNLRRRK